MSSRSQGEAAESHSATSSARDGESGDLIPAALVSQGSRGELLLQDGRFREEYEEARKREELSILAARLRERMAEMDAASETRGGARSGVLLMPLCMGVSLAVSVAMSHARLA